MHIVVCLKQVLDPEVTPREFRIDPQTNRPVQGSVKMVMDSYAENALEAAIQLRDKIPGATVTALCLGDKPAEEVLRRALAFTANAAVRVWDPAWADLPGQAVGHILARAVVALGGAQILLTGRQAGDVEEGLVGPVMAEELDIPCVTLVTDLQVEGDRVRVTREADGGYAVLSTPLPGVFTITNSVTNLPRLPKIKDVMVAKSKPIRLLGPAEIQPDPEQLRPAVKLVRAYVPNTEVACDILPGQDGSELTEQLVGKLVALKVL